MGTGKGQPLASDPDLTLCSLGLWGHGLALRAPELSPSRVSESIRADAEASPLCQHRVNTANRADEDQQGACHSDMVPSGEVRLSLFLVPCMILLSTCWQQPVPPAPCSPAGGPWAGVGGPDSRLPLGGAETGKRFLQYWHDGVGAEEVSRLHDPASVQSSHRPQCKWELFSAAVVVKPGLEAC